MIGTKLNELLRARGMNVLELSRRSGVSAQTIYSIIKRDNMKIDFETLLKFCRELEVPLESFYPDGEGPELPTQEEWQLIRRYRALDERGKKIVNAVLDTELA